MPAVCGCACVEQVGSLCMHSDQASLTALHTQWPGKGGEIARAAGSAAVIKSKDEQFAVVEMPSGAGREGDAC